MALRRVNDGREPSTADEALAVAALLALVVTTGFCLAVFMARLSRPGMLDERGSLLDALLGATLGTCAVVIVAMQRLRREQLYQRRLAIQSHGPTASRTPCHVTAERKHREATAVRRAQQRRDLRYATSLIGVSILVGPLTGLAFGIIFDNGMIFGALSPIQMFFGAFVAVLVLLSQLWTVRVVAVAVAAPTRSP
jgi:hypothetical protein